MDEIHRFGHGGQKQGRLQRRIAAAGHRHFFPFEKCAVTDRTVGYAAAGKGFLPRKAQAPVPDASGQDEAFAGIAFPPGPDGFERTVKFHGGGPLHLDFPAQLQHLFQQGVGKGAAADGRQAGIVVHPGGGGYLPAEILRFQHQDFFPSPQAVERRRQPGGPPADYNYIVHFRNPSQCMDCSRYFLILEAFTCFSTRSPSTTTREGACLTP